MSTDQVTGDIGYFNAAEDLAAMLYGDSLIPTDASFEAIRLALIADGSVPTLYEKECLVYGGPLDAEVDDTHPDTDGEGNHDVECRFPKTNAAIASFF